MQSADHVILGVHIHDRPNRAPELQKIFTTYGCNIKTRLGLHEVNGDYCSMNGLVLFEMVGDPGMIARFESELKGFEGVSVQKMVFAHD